MPERSFGRTVRYRRTKLGLSQAKLGELVGRSPSTIRSWERDKSTPNETAVLHALAAILGVDERSLFDKAGQDPPLEVETSPTVEEALATLRPVVEAGNRVSDQREVDEDIDFDVGEEVEIAEIVDMDEPAGLDEERDADAVIEQTQPFEPEPVDDAPEMSEPPLDEKPPSEVGTDTPGAGSADAGSPPATHEETWERPSGALESAASTAVPSESGYVAPPEPFVVTVPTAPVAEPSYVEDEGQRQLYRLRNLATLVVIVALVIALIWALSQGLDALSEWWDGFFGKLRL